ncbi:MAG: sensory histidine kinase AtoS [Methanomassiliicoccales archaeon PtaU1.Bin124]|nr:MAG: sensory histidine kinase AtoS [Methanomassiliicoccales archaeon PtaU1.Bin124]
MLEKRYLKTLVFTLCALFVLYLTSLYSYLFFHVMVEIFILAILFAIGTLAWITRKTNDSYLMTLGIGFFAIAIIDLLHLITYKGMGILPGIDSNLPTQLWIAQKYLEAFCFIGAFLLIGKKVNDYLIGGLFGLFTVGTFAAIYFGVFPACYVEGTGLTPFKVISEYVIAALMAVAWVLLYQRRKSLDRSTYVALSIALFLSIVAEICFTNYLGVYDIFNLIGHLLTLVAFGMIFIAVVYVSITRPLDSMYRSLSTSEEIYRTLGERGHSFLALLDDDNKVVHVNRKMRELIGGEEKDINGKEISLLFHGEGAERLSANIPRLRSREIDSFRQSVKQKGECISILWKGGEADLEGSVRVILTGLDITELERYQEKTSELNDALDLINRILVHDTVNQLSIISGNLDLYKINGKEENLARMDNAIRNMDSLVQRMKRMMRAINEPLDLKAVDVRAMAERVRNNHQVSGFSINIIGECTAMADESLENVLDNLVGNAIRHSGGNVAEIILKKTDLGCTIEVADNGKGMPPELKGTMFQLGTKSRSSKGMGYGLFLVKRLVERFGGSISVFDNAPSGTRFIIELRPPGSPMVDDSICRQAKRDHTP